MTSFFGNADIHIGDLDIGLDHSVPVHMAKAQFEYWSHTHLTIDVVPGRGACSRSRRPTASASSSAPG